MKKITMEDLAIMVANGFSDTSEKFNNLQKDVLRLDKKVDVLTKRVDILSERVDVLTQRMGSLELKVGSLETKVGTHEDKIDSLVTGQRRILDILLNQTASRSEVRELDHRVVRLEQHLKLA